MTPCANNVKEIEWEWFITQVYAKAAISGLSQSTFKSMYPTVTYSGVTINPNYSDPNMVLSAIKAPNTPVVEATKNEHGDAIIAKWTLEPAMVARIYPSQSKTFKCTIKFNSVQKTQYPDLTMDWEWTITLPKLPEIAGYYANYWFNPYEEHDITPVQYSELDGSRYQIFLKTAGVIKEGHLTAYDPADNSVAPGTPYCVFYNDLMNAFQYDGTTGFIVKNLYGCANWDMQFTWTGNDKFAGYPDPNRPSSYKQYDNYAPLKLATYKDEKSPSLYTQKWDEQRTYVLNRLTNADGTAGTPALQMVWGDKATVPSTKFDHTAWDGDADNTDYRNATLYADHKNPANQALLNKLDDKNDVDGWTPLRTHTKPINVGVWATLNNWNIIPVKKYDIYLIEPLRINSSLSGVFEDLIINGTAISCADAFTLTDFAGYDVAKNDIANPSNRKAYRSKLYKYYELTDPEWKTTEVRYGFDETTLKEVAYEDATYEKSIDAAKLKAKTNGNMDLSIDLKKKVKGGKEYEYLVFQNNGGSSVVRDVAVFIPVEVTYGFGKVKAICKVKVTPKGTGKGTPFDDI